MNCTGSASGELLGTEVLRFLYQLLKCVVPSFTIMVSSEARTRLRESKLMDGKALKTPTSKSLCEILEGTI